MTPARLRWGLLFIMFGVLVLLDKMDVISGDVWLDIITLFPLLLIAIGIEKIFTRSRLEFISYAAPVLLVVVVIYVAVDRGHSSSGAGFFESQVIRQEADPNLEVIQAVLRLGDGDLTVRDATDDLFYGRFRQYSYKPRYNYDVHGSRAKIELLNRSGRIWGGLVHINTNEPDDWYLSFSKFIPLELECYGDDADIHLNLSTTPLRMLRLEADDAEIYLKLGNVEPEVQVEVSGYDSNLRLRVPHESGLRVKGVDDDVYLHEVGLTEQDDGFVNEGFDSLNQRIEVDLDDRFRSLSIDYY